MSFFKFKRDVRGAAAIEFALIFPIFLMVVLALFELGLYAYTSVALQSIVARASREASINQLTGAGTRAQQVESMIKDRSVPLIGSSNLQINTRVINVGAAGGYDSGTQPDLCLDPYGVGVPVCNGSFEDLNNNGVYDAAATTNNAGNASEVVEITVRLPWRANFGWIRNIFGENGVGLITASTIVKNEPFDN